MAKGASIEELAARRRWTAEEAEAVIGAAERSGMSLRQFAVHHGMDAQRLYRWRRELRRDADGGPELRFEEVVVRSAADGEPRACEKLELALASGHVVRVGPNFDADALRRLLAVLAEIASC